MAKDKPAGLTDELLKSLEYLLEGKIPEAQNAVFEHMARTNLHPDSLLFAAQICRMLGAQAPVYTGYRHGADSCALKLADLGLKLADYLDKFGRP